MDDWLKQSGGAAAAAPSSTATAHDDGSGAATAPNQQQQQQQQHAGESAAAAAGPSAFGDGRQGPHLDRLISGREAVITHARPDEHLAASIADAAAAAAQAAAAAATAAEQQQQRGSGGGTSGAPPPRERGGAHRNRAARGAAEAAAAARPPRDASPPRQPPAAPRPHPLRLRPRHVKTNYKCPTPDGWRLHVVRTQRLADEGGGAGGPRRSHPVILCPGLGSSGAYCFDLAPAVSLADFLAARGWDVWTVELRGNGQSDKPSLLAGRGRWWTIDTHVEKDVPALLRFVLHEAKAPQAHFLGHSMGGMVLCGVMARNDAAAARIRSCIAVGSGLFLEESWWRMFEPLMPFSRLLWTVPSGGLLRRYAPLMLGPWRVPFIDMLYFYPSNVDARVARALMARNFSNISVGVIRQITTAFGPRGLTTADGRAAYAEPSRLGRVAAPCMFLVGDTDRMCPPAGARRTWEMWGARDKRFVCMGPAAGFASHYGHFDPLVGRRAAAEVFPLIADFLERHDEPRAPPAPAARL